MGHLNDKTWHHLAASEVLEALEVDGAKGLTNSEVEQREKHFGSNRVTAKRGVPAWKRWLQQFHQPLVYILLVAGAVTASLGEWIDASVIFSVVLVNAIIGFLQEAKAEKSIEALAKMVATETNVRRDGHKHRLHSDQLVPGDVVLLQAGDRVPADLRLLRVRELQADESALTGESAPVGKQTEPLPAEAPLADRTNLVFAGTMITMGDADGVVYAIGDQTETGRIGQLIASALEVSTPLTKKVSEFSKLVLWVVLALAAATFALGVARGESVMAMFMAAVALAVGAIPEGLTAAVTIVLAIGVSRLAKRKAIIRKLTAVETLGSTTVICSDKTGTLTENQMTVQEIFADGNLYHVTGTGYETKGDLLHDAVIVIPAEHPVLTECLHAGLLCNDSQLVRDKHSQLKVVGDPTEAAMLVSAAKGGLIHEAIHRASPRVDMIPFASESMFRATLHEAKEGRMIYQVGALEQLLEKCTDALADDKAHVPLDRPAVLQAAEAMASRGLRVIGMARRRVDAKHSKLVHANVSEQQTFIGLQGMMDPPRAAATAAVTQCQRAGIAVKMITGDHLATARAIARQIGLHGPGEEGNLVALSGRELELISDADLPAVAERTTVFARVAPEQKLRLVRALQSLGHVVAMTGDGVNDAPALKQADIGVAMGAGGTDVAKGAAAMILTDDNFATIAGAVEEGRGVFDNITKFITWIIPTNLGEAVMLLSAIVLGLPLPLLPLQLLWINLTDTLLGLSLAFEPKESDVMTRPPRAPQQPLLTRALMMRSGLVAGIMLCGGLGLFYWELHVNQSGLPTARTVAVNTIVLVQIAYLFNCRSLTRSIRAIGWFTNRWAIIGSLAMLGAQLIFTYLPVMHRLFHSAPLSLAAWGRIAGVAVLACVAVEFEKWVRLRHVSQRPAA